MNNRQRILDCLDCKPIDRTVVSPFIYKNFVKEFKQDAQADILQGTVDVCRHFGFDLMLRALEVGFAHEAFACDTYQVEKIQKETKDGAETTTIVRTPVRELREVVRTERLSPYHEVFAYTERLIKEPEDLDAMIRFMGKQPKVDEPKIARARSLAGLEGVVAPYSGGVFNCAERLRDLESLLIDPYEDEDFYHSLMAFVTEKLIAYLAAVLDAGADIINYGGNIANGTVAGPRFFREHIAAYERQVVGAIRQHGGRVLYHNCGDGKNMIEEYNALGINAFETMTEAPFADMDLRDCVARFDPDIALMGNVDQIDFLRHSTPGQVRGLALEKLCIAGHRSGFILSTSDFIEENTPHENLFALVEAARDFDKEAREPHGDLRMHQTGALQQ